MVIGIDAGRGTTSAATRIDRVNTFSSYVLPGRTLDMEVSNDLLDVTIDEKRWFIGELARREGGTREFQKEKAGHRNTTPLVLTAAAAAFPGERITSDVVVGLPVSDYYEQAAAMEQAVSGKHIVKLPGQRPQTIHFASVTAFPEGAGALWHVLMDRRGRVRNELAGKTLAMIDVGWKTCNFVVIRSLEYDNALSGTIPAGLSRAFRTLYKRFSRQRDINPSQAEKLLATHGRDDLAGLAAAITDQLAMWWTDPAREFDHVFMAGGGGKLLAPHMNWPVQVVDRPLVANALGFYKVAVGRAA